MNRHDPIDDPRRALLIRALAAGLYAVGGGASADFFGRVPEKLRPGRSFYRIKGGVTVDGRAADERTVVGAGAVVETAPGGQAVFAVGDDAFLLRGGGRMELVADEEGLLVKGMRLLSGGLLTVFGRRPHTVHTAVATIGIRGTGVYAEAERGRSYVCTCYGDTELAVTAAPQVREAIHSRHHDAPRYVYGVDDDGGRIVAAPFKNHSDLELMLLEELVGRTPPFSVAGDRYGPPRRDY
ncbi:FecR family protein [Endothiovibrio diazotrophicus]